MQADEHARVVEPATKIIYGFGTVSWELEPNPLYPPNLPLVSWLLAVIHAPVLFVTKFLGLSGLTEVSLLRVWTSLFCATRIFALKNILDFLPLQKSRKTIYLLLLCFLFYNPILLVRTSQENWATTTLIWAFYFALKLIKETKFSDALLFGIFSALTVSFRLQMGFSVLFLGLFLFAKQRSTMIPSLIGILIGLLPMAIVDWKFTGIPFFPAWNYLKYAFFEGSTPELWGEHGPLFYPIGFLGHWYPPLSPFLLILICMGCWKFKPLAMVVFPFTIIHFLLSHKEIRYFVPLIPFMHFACFVGWEQIEKKMSRSTVEKILKFAIYPFVVCYSILGVLWALLIPANTSPLLYDQMNKEVEAHPQIKLFYVGNTRVNVSMTYYKHPENLPTQITEDDFVKTIEENPQSIVPGVYALYRIDAPVLRKVEKQCKLIYLAGGETYRTVLELFDKIPKRKRLDAMVACGV